MAYCDCRLISLMAKSPLSLLMVPLKLLPVCLSVMPSSSCTVTEEPVTNGPFCDTPATSQSLTAVMPSDSSLVPVVCRPSEQAVTRIAPSVSVGRIHFFIFKSFLVNILYSPLPGVPWTRFKFSVSGKNWKLSLHTLSGCCSSATSDTMRLRHRASSSITFA